jgi:glycosyltransferase domain-containing protein
MLDNLTILITTYNRYTLLKRLITFYNSFDFEVKIIVLDSSSNTSIDKDLYSMLNSKNIIWKKYDPEIFFANKIADGSQLIKTEFSVLCADDDFIFPYALEEAIDYLKKNKDFSSCLGNQYKHHILNFFGKKFVIFQQSSVNGSEIIDNDCFDRILKYMSGKSIYYPFYAVHRSNDLKKIWKQTSAYVDYWGLSEVLPCAISLTLGKMRVMNIPYTTRERNNFVWYNEKNVLKMYSYNKIEKAKNGLIEVLSETNDNDIKKNNNFVNKVFEILVDRLVNKSLKKNKYTSLKTIIKNTIKNFPFLGSFIFKIYIYLFRFIRLYLLNKVLFKNFLGHNTKKKIEELLKSSEYDLNEVNKSRKDYDFN